MSVAIKAKQLRKVFKGGKGTGDVEALKSLDLIIPQGKIFGLLGPNGAGKSTFINILSGLCIKTAGEAWVNGYEVSEARRQASQSLGIVPQEITLDPFFSPFDNLELMAGLYGIPKGERRTMELLTAVDLEHKAHVNARELSGGMKRRLMLAKAMVHSPPILILDEPTAGVDIELRRALWVYVRKLNKQGTTIVLTTHYLEEAEAMCDRIAIIDEGRIIAEDNTADLMGRLSGKTLVLTLENPRKTVPKTLLAMNATLETPRRITLPFQPGRQNIKMVLSALSGARVAVKDINVTGSNLEDVFMSLTYDREGRGDQAA